MGVSKIGGRLSIKGSVTIGGDVVLSRGAANRLDLAAGDTFRIATDGALQFGSDVNLSRGAADRLDLASGDTLRLTAGLLDLGADVQVTRTAADRVGLASGDELDLKTNGNDLRLPGGTAALATATFGSATNRVRIGTNGGTPALGFELNGTTFFVNNSGSL